MTMDEIHAWHGDSSTDSLKPMCRYCNPRWEDKDPIALDPGHDINAPISRSTAINYSLAGRADPSHSFRDLRSPSKARRRHRQRLEKYFAFRGVSPGQLGEPHYVPSESRLGFSHYADPLPQTPADFVMSKAQLYRDAQEWPRPPKLHRSKPREKRAWGTSDRQNGPKHARQRFAANVEAGLEYVLADGDGVFDRVVPCSPLCPRFAAEECGCACELCHPECHEQKQREWDAECDAETDENDAEEWEVQSKACAGEHDGCDEEEWEVLSAPASSSGEGLEGETAQMDGWLLVSDPAQRDPSPTRPPPATSTSQATNPTHATTFSSAPARDAAGAASPISCWATAGASARTPHSATWPS